MLNRHSTKVVTDIHTLGAAEKGIMLDHMVGQMDILLHKSKILGKHNSKERIELEASINKLVAKIDSYNKKLTEHIGIKIMQRRNRMSKRMTQEELGKKCGVHSGEQVRKWEKGIRRPSASRLALIASAQKVNIAYYYDGFLNWQDSDFSQELKVMCNDLVEYFINIDSWELKRFLLNQAKQLSEL